MHFVGLFGGLVLLVVLKVRRFGPMVSSEVGAQEKRFLLNQSPNVQNVSASVRRFNRIEVDSVLEDRKQDQIEHFSSDRSLGLKEQIFGSSPGRLVATVATYCLSKPSQFELIATTKLFD